MSEYRTVPTTPPTPAMTEAQYRADRAGHARLIDLVLKVTGESQPIPTQEEIDMTRLGLLPQGVSDPHSPEMPPIAAQQAMLREPMHHAGSISASAPAAARQARA